MANISKEFLSGSTNGRGVKVAATATAGTTIHTAHATSKDEVYLWASNDSSSDVALTLEVGGTTDPDDLIQVTIPARGTVGGDGAKLVCPGLILSNSLVLKAFAGSGNVITLFGFVNRIS